MIKVKIEVTLEQAEFIRQSLDWASRTSMGQLKSNYLPGAIEEILYEDPKENKEWLYRRDLWDSLAETLKKVLHPSLGRNAFKSYSHSEFSKNCCSMEKMLAVKMQEFRYKDEEEKPFNVNSSFIDIYKVPVAKIEIK